MALVQLTGVLESGGNRGAKVPGNPRRTIRLTQSESLTIRLTVFASSGYRLPLDVGQTLVLTVRKNSSMGFTLFPERDGVVQTQLGVGVVDFEIAPSDTQPLLTQPGQYIYDIWMTALDGSRDVLVPLSPFILEPAVGQP